MIKFEWWWINVGQSVVASITVCVLAPPSLRTRQSDWFSFSKLSNVCKIYNCEYWKIEVLFKPLSARDKGTIVVKHSVSSKQLKKFDGWSPLLSAAPYTLTSFILHEHLTCWDQSSCGENAYFSPFLHTCRTSCTFPRHVSAIAHRRRILTLRLSCEMRSFGKWILFRHFARHIINVSAFEMLHRS